MGNEKDKACVNTGNIIMNLVVDNADVCFTRRYKVDIPVTGNSPPSLFARYVNTFLYLIQLPRVRWKNKYELVSHCTLNLSLTVRKIKYTQFMMRTSHYWLHITILAIRCDVRNNNIWTNDRMAYVVNSFQNVKSQI